MHHICLILLVLLILHILKINTFENMEDYDPTLSFLDESNNFSIKLTFFFYENIYFFIL